MDVSVIVPTYRPQDYLWECLDSLYRQTLSKESFEVVVVLNGTISPYDEQINQYIRRHPDLNVVFLKTEVGGVSHARNLALDKAKGTYIAFVDDDDYVSETYLEEMLSVADNDTVALSYPYSFMDGDAGRQCPYRQTEAYEYCVSHGCRTLKSPARKLFAGPCMKLIPAWMIGKRRFDVRFKVGEDSIFMFLISDCVDRVSFTSKRAVYYRRVRKNSTLASRTLKDILKNNLRCMGAYTRIFLSNRRYSWYMYSTRMLATCLVVWIRIVDWIKK